MPDRAHTCVSFEDIFRDELADIAIRRAQTGASAIDPNARSPTTSLDLVGLSLSGGGIRSASFSLGVLQALTQHDLLKRIDYLSTVSGGGYIGSFLTSTMSRNGGECPFATPGRPIEDTAETRHIRDNSRYLIQNGVPSIISAAGVYLRGLVLSFFTVTPILLTLSAALLLYGEALGRLRPVSDSHPFHAIAILPMPITVACLLILCAVWTLYAIMVSIWRTAEIETRRLLSFIAGSMLTFVLLIAVVEFHVWLTKRHDNIFAGFADSSLFGSGLAALGPVIVAALPFVKTLSEWVEGDPGARRFIVVKRAAGIILLVLLCALVPLAIWVTLYYLTAWGVCPQQAPDLYKWAIALFPDQHVAVTYLMVAAVILFFLWPMLSVNANSLHQLYRDRLSRAFLVKPGAQSNFVSADNFKLSELDARHAPYHLLNAAINVPGSKVANLRGRNAEYFLFSPRYVGSRLTGYVSTTLAEEAVDRLTLGTAMAISGAAAAPNMGMVSVRPLSPTLALLNFRLGRWFEHPASIARSSDNKDRWYYPALRWYRRRPHPRFLLREAFFKTGLHLGKDKSVSVDDRFVYLTDGGHIENLGIYELLRRRCRLIIAVDAEADPGLVAPSLAQLQRFAVIDLAVRIDLHWRPIATTTKQARAGLNAGPLKTCHGPHIAAGLIEYPPLTIGGEHETGVLLYVKSSLTGDEPDYVLKYAADHADFPHESTADQLFSEEQLEVYRALGEHAVRKFLRGQDGACCNPQDEAAIRTIVEKFFALGKIAETA